MVMLAFSNGLCVDRTFLARSGRVNALISKSFKNLFNVSRDLNLTPYFLYVSMWIDEKRASFYAHIFFSVHTFFFPDATCSSSKFLGGGTSESSGIFSEIAEDCSSKHSSNLASSL